MTPIQVASEQGWGACVIPVFLVAGLAMNQQHNQTNMTGPAMVYISEEWPDCCQLVVYIYIYICDMYSKIYILYINILCIA